MPFLNPKAATIKLPRRTLTPQEVEHLLDVALACSYTGYRAPTNDIDRKEFEDYILRNPHSKISEKVKAALAQLTEGERKLLFD